MDAFRIFYSEYGPGVLFMKSMFYMTPVHTDTFAERRQHWLVPTICLKATKPEHLSDPGIKLIRMENFSTAPNNVPSNVCSAIHPSQAADNDSTGTCWLACCLHLPHSFPVGSRSKTKAVASPSPETVVFLLGLVYIKWICWCLHIGLWTEGVSTLSPLYM